MSSLAYNSAAEIRIRQNRARRNRELKRRLLIAAFSFVLLITLVILFCVKSDAHEADKVTYFKYYKSIEIEPGDTLWSIADVYVNPEKNNKNSFVKEVCYINNIDDASAIVVGDHLVIPYYDEFHS